MNIDKKFRGNIYVVQNNRVVIEHVSGMADLANEIPNTIDTKFASASAGKVFVAIAILQLIEQRKLNFEDTLGKLLDIDLHKIDVDVTVEQLLNHTSGVPDYFDESIMDEYEKLWIEFPNYKIRHNNDHLIYFQGCDPGVSFISEYNPNNGMISVLVSNYGDNVWKEMRKIRENI